MKPLLFALIFLFAAVIAAAPPQQTNGPLSKAEVMNLVKFEMNSADLVKKIKDLGIDFEPDDDYLQSLRQVGAPDQVIQALREARPRPLTREQVGKLVAGGVPSQRAAMLVKQRGIDFVVDEEYIKSLRLAGADDALIAALHQASAAVTAELHVTTSPQADISLDGDIEGQADTRGEWSGRAKPGAHTLKISLKGKKDFEQNVTLVARQTTKIEARLEEIGPSPGPVRENPKDGLKYVWVPPGTFMMGCSPGDSACMDTEMPAHQVMITRGFWMGQTPVTVGGYKRYSGDTGRQMPPAPEFNNGWANEKMPIVGVAWDEALAYCGWAGGRLPTEAEWEYAARGGSGEPRYGSLNDIAWYDSNSGGQSHDVAQKQPNRFGLYDMLGNVWEWVNDWYEDNYYENSPSVDPPGPRSGELHALRGGSWLNHSGDIRVSLRISSGPRPVFGAGLRGFRCVGEAGM